MSTQTPDSSTDRGVRAHSQADEAGRRGRRLASAIAGGALLTLGARRRSLAGATMAAAGGWLLYRGVRGKGRSRGDQKMDAGPASYQGDSGTDREEPASDRKESQTDSPSVERSVTVGKPADELHELWRDPETLTRVFGDRVSVTAAGDDRLHWSLDGPLGRTIEWDAEIVADRTGELLRWESVADATLPSVGSVAFRPAPADRGTEVTLRLEFYPPGGRLGDAAMEALGVVPESLAGTALARFKGLAETGEIATIERNPSGRGSGDAV